MSKLQSDEKREVLALQMEAQLELQSNPQLYDGNVKEVVSDLNQLRPWVVVSSTLDIHILLLHIQACALRTSKSELNKDSKNGRRMRRILKHTYIEALLAVIDVTGSAPSPAIQHVKLMSRKTEYHQYQGNVI